MDSWSKRVIRSVVPAETTEVISYGIPMFKYREMLLGYAAFKNHCSLFPTGSGVIEKFEKELEGFPTPRGTIRFPSDKLLPDSLLKKTCEDPGRGKQRMGLSKSARIILGH